MPLDHAANRPNPTSSETMLPHLRAALLDDATRLMEDVMGAEPALAAIDVERPVALARRGELLRLSARLSRVAGWLLSDETCGDDIRTDAVIALTGAAPGELDAGGGAPELADLRNRIDRLTERALRLA